jgi:hypothetical protein
MTPEDARELAERRVRRGLASDAYEEPPVLTDEDEAALDRAAAKKRLSRICVATDFSRWPGGRWRTDGPFTGERFRDELLLPALREHGRVTVDLDGAWGYGSSFLDEAFGALAREPDRFGLAGVDLPHAIIVETASERLRATVEDLLRTGGIPADVAPAGAARRIGL